jgi:hypothetical protein
LVRMSYVEEQKIGVVVRDNPANHLARLYAMKIVIGDKYSVYHILDRDFNGIRATLRRERSLTSDLPRQAREAARKWRILRNNIEVIYENAEPKTKKTK